jgi:malyl-CoA/(S)-citramalyl-CoA lyase
MLDLEDAVAPADKERANEQITAAQREHNWSGCSVSLRINGLDTHRATATSSTWSSRPAGASTPC